MMREGVEGFEMPFEEASWRKMESLLDNEKDKRRPVFWMWWLLPILVGGPLIGYFMMRDPVAHKAKNTNAPLPINTVTVSQPNKAPGGATGAVPGSASSKQGASSGAVAPINLVNPAKPINERALADLSQKKAGQSNEPVSNYRIKAAPVDNSSAKTRVSIKGNEAAEDIAQIPADNGQMKFSHPSQKDSAGTTEMDKVGGTEADPPLSAGAPGTLEEVHVQKVADSVPVNSTTRIKTANTKNDQPTLSRWYVIVAAGAGGSSTKMLAVDRLTPAAGVHIGYRFTNHISAQTGLFAGSKKYSAGAGDYKAKAGTYWSMVNLLNVDANCLVLEIPLNLRYDLNPKGGINYFATAGLSSYVMKKENYFYSYNRYGYTNYAEANYKGNEHFLSVLRLSAGLEKKLSNKLLLNVAPGVSIPLAGVGEGRVKLYSTEIMLGLKYQPLRKTREK